MVPRGGLFRLDLERDFATSQQIMTILLLRRLRIGAGSSAAGRSNGYAGSNADVPGRAYPRSHPEHGQHHHQVRVRRVPEAPASTSPPRPPTGVGSGFVIDPSGLIATNWHVVTDAAEIVVTFSDGTRVPAKVAGAWRVADLGLLQVDTGHPLQAVRWGDSSAMQIGDPVLAMGNAFGVGSVSAGIIALNRDIGDSPVDQYIQTDAAINHGNSGGPLFNLKDDVIGVRSSLSP